MAVLHALISALRVQMCVPSQRCQTFFAAQDMTLQAEQATQQQLPAMERSIQMRVPFYF